MSELFALLAELGAGSSGDSPSANPDPSPRSDRRVFSDGTHYVVMHGPPSIPGPPGMELIDPREADGLIERIMKTVRPHDPEMEK